MWPDTVVWEATLEGHLTLTLGSTIKVAQLLFRPPEGVFIFADMLFSLGSSQSTVWVCSKFLGRDPPIVSPEAPGDAARLASDGAGVRGENSKPL